MPRKAAPLFAAALAAFSVLGRPLDGEACSVRFEPWQRRAVWPPSSAPVPLNARFFVFIPALSDRLVVLPPLPAPVPALSGRIVQPAAEPTAQLAAGLSLRELDAQGGAGAEVPTRWLARRDGAGLSLELVPRVPLRPQAEYVVQLLTSEGPQRLGGGLRTGTTRDERAPVWQGIKSAVYEPPVRSKGPGGDCRQLWDHDRQVALKIHEATDESVVHYAVWLALPWDKVQYEETPHAYLTPRQGSLVVEQLPETAPRLRIGVRAVDAAGNLSPPSEVVLDVMYSPR